MSVNKLGVTLLSGFLIFATALVAPAQSTAPSQDQSTKKQTTAHKETASKDDIRNAQQALKDKGLYTGPVDGSMNAETTKALRDFQKKNNLEVTGTLNHDTMTTLGVTPHPSTTGKDTSKTGTPGTTTPKKEKGKPTSGVTEDKVRDVQAALQKEGFDPGPLDGIMGPKTTTALKDFQSHNGLEVTGTINTETEKALMASAGTTRRSKPGTSESEPVPQSRVSSVEDVRHIQQALSDLGYEPGDVNGLMTSQTQQAIREFQFLNNLPVTGNLDEQTKTAIDAQYRGGSGSTNYGSTSSAILEREKTNMGAFTLVATKAGKEKLSKSDDKDGSERIAKATEVLQDLTTTGDRRIPNALLERAEAIAVIPNMIKGAFGIGGRFGKGVISQRLPDGRWSPPAFLHIGGGSFGAQLGVSSTDLVLVFTDRNALNLLAGGKDLKIGADASAVAGPIGRSAEAGTNIKLESAIYSYSRSKGLFAGVALDGAVLDIDKDKNEEVYGTSDARAILNGRVAANTTVQPFMNALEKVSPKKRLSQK